MNQELKDKLSLLRRRLIGLGNIVEEGGCAVCCGSEVVKDERFGGFTICKACKGNGKFKYQQDAEFVFVGELAKLEEQASCLIGLNYLKLPSDTKFVTLIISPPKGRLAVFHQQVVEHLDSAFRHMAEYLETWSRYQMVFTSDVMVVSRAFKLVSIIESVNGLPPKFCWSVQACKVRLR